MRWAVGALLSATAAFAAPPGPSPGPASGPASSGHPTINPWIDAPLTVGLFGAWAGLHAGQPGWVETRCPCTRGQVNAFDRVAVGGHFKAAELTADVFVVGALGLALAAPLVTADDGDAWLNDAALVLESMALAGLLTEVSKIAAGRPYPYMYNPAPYPEQNADGINYASFWSGHTAVPMAAAVTAARLIELRAPDSPWRWIAWIAGPSLALSGGVWQIVAHNHFPTDVIAGAGVGVGVGLLVPWVHTF